MLRTPSGRKHFLRTRGGPKHFPRIRKYKSNTSFFIFFRKFETFSSDPRGVRSIFLRTLGGSEAFSSDPTGVRSIFFGPEGGPKHFPRILKYKSNTSFFPYFLGNLKLFLRTRGGSEAFSSDPRGVRSIFLGFENINPIRHFSHIF